MLGLRAWGLRTSLPASASGDTVDLTSCQNGNNYALSAAVTYDTKDFSSASFTATPSGSTLTGGTSQDYDTGTATVSVTDAGGTVLSEAIEIPAGRFAYCLDTEGNSIGIFSR